MQVDTRDAYLELLKQSLTRALFVEEERSRGRRRRLVAEVMHQLWVRGYVVVPAVPAVAGRTVRRVPGLPGSGALTRLLARRGFAVIPDTHATRARLGPPARSSHRRLRGHRRRLARTEREFGLDWPAHAETMIGLRRLDDVEACVVDVLRRDVPGDLLEAGVWRGGTTIFMRAVLAAYDDDRRRVWVADSFQGLPAPDPDAFPADAGLDYTGHAELSVGVQQVRANFARYGLLDDRVEFLPGWFKDTLPNAPIERLAVLRLDGDLYESTMDALEALYPKLSVGGYCIVDDYGALEACRRAVDDYRAAHGITEEIEPVDWTAVSWRRERA
ncbi:MAG TPA: TylF/MycF/NovP-related O-methyltransferase [Acidimicrobiia bacterium]